MIDPLENFEWNRLYELYDKLCVKFNPKSIYLFSNYQLPKDRDLYYELVKNFDHSKITKAIKLNDYKAMLYWKLYSQPAAVANILNNIESREPDLNTKLNKAVRSLPEKLNDKNIIIKVIKDNELFSIHGMKTPTSLPVRSTFLHFFYPDVVPVFDRMVLQAVGENREDANHDINVMEEYILFNWMLADKYKNRFNSKWCETPVRIIDMALWIARGNK